MRHVKEVDGREHTVIMIQVENEVGMQGDTRDRSPLANQAFEGPVPKELMDYLQQHKDTLIPELRKVWEAAGFKTSGTWEEVFGKGRPTDEIFMAWHFARYVGRVVEAGKAEYPIPMFTNCPQHGFGTAPRRSRRTERWPDARRDGRLESRGAANRSVRGRHLRPTSWRFARKYTQSGNPLFIAETSAGPDGAPGRSTLSDATTLSAFHPSARQLGGPRLRMIGAYDLISQLAPLILEHQGNGTMSAVCWPQGPAAENPVGGSQSGGRSYQGPRERARHRPGQQKPRKPPRCLPAAAIFIATGPDEYDRGRQRSGA